MDNRFARRSAGAGSLRKGEQVNFEVMVLKAEIPHVFGFSFESLDDALKFAQYCLSNGYRVTIIPRGAENEI